METIEKPLRSILKRSDAPKGKIRLAILCSILNKIWDLAPPLLIGVAVDVVVRKEDSLLADWGIIDPWNQLLVLAVATQAELSIVKVKPFSGGGRAALKSATATRFLAPKTCERCGRPGSR